MEKDIWNIELLKSGPDRFTIVFLTYNNSIQKIIRNDNVELYNVCDQLHKSDITFWEVESVQGEVPKEFDSIDVFLKNKLDYIQK